MRKLKVIKQTDSAQVRVGSHTRGLILEGHTLMPAGFGNQCQRLKRDRMS